jgi:hypothetical protein
MKTKRLYILSIFKGSLLFFIAINFVYIFLFNWDSFSSIYSKKNIKETYSNFLTFANIYPFLIKDDSVKGFNKSENRFFISTVSELGDINILETHSNNIIDFNLLFQKSTEDKKITRFDRGQISEVYFYNPNQIEFPLNLIRLISLDIIHGTLDNSLNYSEQIKKIKHSNLSLTCGESIFFLKNVLNQFNIQSRIIFSFAKVASSQYDNGHTMLEVFLPNLQRWVLVDFDSKTLFKLDGKYLSFFDLLNSGIDSIKFYDLSKNKLLDYSSFDKYSIIWEYNNKNLLNWYKKVFNYFAIENDTIFYKFNKKLFLPK